MYLTFKNNSTNEKMIVSVENQKYIINPETSVEVFCRSENVMFDAQTLAFNELTDAVNEIDSNDKKDTFKDRILLKLTKKLVEKLPEIVLNTSVKYEISCANSQNTVIDLYECVYSVCDGNLADFLDLMPVIFVFSRAETANSNIRVVDANANNRKKFLKLMRKFLLFMHWGFIFLNLTFFIPEYLTIKFYSSHFYIKKLFRSLYNKPVNKRTSLITKKEQRYEKEEKNKGCLTDIVKVFIVFLILGGICFWALTSEPDVLISEDFQSIVCFNETFVKIESGLPADAEDVFLEDYSAYYPLSDGGYDMDNYYCYIYETPDGTRYMWLKDNCTNDENAHKEYKDYKNPLVYKSVGEQE